MRRIQRITQWILASGTIALCAKGATAQALSFSASGELGGDEVHVVFSELGLAAQGIGLKPFAALGGYMVFTSGTDNWGVTPSVGVRYVTIGGVIEGAVGWALVEDNAVSYFRGDDSGFLTSIRTEFLGEVYNAEGIAIFNWGPKYLWSRGRLGRTMGAIGTGGSWGLGGELVYQAETEDPLPNVQGLQVTQIGPVLTLLPQAGGPSFSLSGGWKKTDFGLADESSWYVRADIYLR